MSDYISRQAAIDAIANCTNCGTPDELRKYVDKHSLENGWTGGVLDAMEAVEYIPAADVVPVVRCKDCKHVYCRIYHGWQEPIYTCTHLRSRWNTDNDLEVNPDGFCSYGERREE